MLTVKVRLRHERYDAALQRPSIPEWPPHPARLFCALVASATDEADRTALRWLEQMAAPEVWACPDIEVSQAVGYVVTNSLGNASQFWPSREARYKQRTSALPANASFAFVWKEATPDDAALHSLARLARRVPYLGRSTSPVEVTVSDATVVAPGTPTPHSQTQAWVAFQPAPWGTLDATELRVPYPGYLDTLQRAYDSGRPSHRTHWSMPYTAATAAARVDLPTDPVRRRVQAMADTDQVRAARVDLPTDPARPYHTLIFRTPDPQVPVSGDRLFAVTEALRRAVMHRVPDPLPPAVSGHTSNNTPHVGYLALLDVGHCHADGHLLGVAVVLPDGLSADDRHTVVRALISDGPGGNRLSRLRIDMHTQIDLEYQPDQVWDLLGRWSGPTTGTTKWVTVTPVMLDKHPRRRLTPACVLADSLVTAGYPRPSAVEFLPSSPVTGGVHRPLDSPGRRLPPRPLVHCRVEFPTPVIGPVIAGSVRNFGCGLFTPAQSVS